MIEYLHQQPKNIPRHVFDEILKLISKGNQSPANKTERVLKNAHLVSYAKKGDLILSTASLKNPTSERKSEVFKKSKTKLQNNDFDFELGFWSTLPEYSNQGILTRLISEQLEFIPVNSGIFCILRHPYLISKLIKEFQFKSKGETFQLDFNSRIYSLVVK